MGLKIGLPSTHYTRQYNEMVSFGLMKLRLLGITLIMFLVGTIEHVRNRQHRNDRQDLLGTPIDRLTRSTS